MIARTLGIYLATAALTAVLAVAPYAWKASFEPAPVLAAPAGGSAKAANLLGMLSPARASSAAHPSASPAAMIGYVDTYETEMKTAVALQDPARRATAITAARANLALVANKQLTPAAIARIDGLLGLPAAPATLGTTGR